MTPMDSSGRAGPGDVALPPVPPASRRKALWVGGMALLMALLLGLLYAFNSFRSHAIADFFAHSRPPPAIVAMTVAERQSVPHYLGGIGSIAAVHQVTIASQVGGAVTQILFTAGQDAAAGQPLVQLDDGPEQGDLKNFEAQQRYDALTLKRNQELATKQAVAQSTVDQSQSLLDQANAGIAKTKALIAQKLIRAPFAGRLGVRLVEVGQYVAPGTAMVSLTDLSRLYINFTLPEQTAASLTAGQEVEIGVDAYPEQRFKAKINAIEPQVTADTRTIKLQAVMDNPEGKLLPGMFANVRVLLPARPDVITVPETAVENTLYGDSVYVVEPEGSDDKGQPLLKAKRVPVTTGEHVGGRVAILSGVKAGDRVVALGQNKVLFDGAAVAPSGNEGLALPAKIPTN
ncbi:MAG TPA: efflux RND transporter periplasmic adaptor subunit [Stellaceae bacterium]|nr:efflux RND transporter periplasmic adaptor subunit [Stellaceae bacterium]